MWNDQSWKWLYGMAGSFNATFFAQLSPFVRRPWPGFPTLVILRRARGRDQRSQYVQPKLTVEMLADDSTVKSPVPWGTRHLPPRGIFVTPTRAGHFPLSAILENAPGKFHPNQLCASLVRGLHLRLRFSKGSYMAVVRHADFTGSLPTPP